MQNLTPPEEELVIAFRLIEGTFQRWLSLGDTAREFVRHELQRRMAEVALWAPSRGRRDRAAGVLTVRRLLKAELCMADPYCGYCRRPLSLSGSVLDHAPPRSRGGSNQPSNAILCCRPCDRAKGDRTVSEWRDGLAAGLFQLTRERKANQ